MHIKQKARCKSSADSNHTQVAKTNDIPFILLLNEFHWVSAKIHIWCQMFAQFHGCMQYTTDLQSTMWLICTCKTKRGANINSMNVQVFMVYLANMDIGFYDWIHITNKHSNSLFEYTIWNTYQTGTNLIYNIQVKIVLWYYNKHRNADVKLYIHLARWGDNRLCQSPRVPQTFLAIDNNWLQWKNIRKMPRSAMI